MPAGIFEVILTRYLAGTFPALYSGLEAVGIVGYEEVDTTQAKSRPDTMRTRLYFEAIPEVLADPIAALQFMCAWGMQELDFEVFVRWFGDLLWSIGVPTSLDWVPDDLGAAYRFTAGDAGHPEKMLVLPFGMLGDEEKAAGLGLGLIELPGDNGKPAGIIVQPLIPEEASLELELTDELKLIFKAGAAIKGKFGLILRPGEVNAVFPQDSTAKLPDAGFSASIAYAPSQAKVLFGHPQKSRLQLGGASVGLDCRSQKGEWDLAGRVKTVDLMAVISAADLDGFFRTLLGNSDLKIVSPFELGLSSRTGLSFQGGPGLEITAHPHLELGPATISQYQVRLRSTLGGNNPDVILEASLNVGGKLGPLAASIEGIGMNLVVAFKEGNAGPMDIKGGFKAPSGMGILVDAGPVTGGGVLSFDEANGRYSGVLQLKVYEVAVKAIGLLDTKLPGGEAGFSFLVIITAEFTDIQLGFGFTLKGVGGLAGIHRTVVTEEIQSGIRSGSIDRLLFPKDPVANASRLISDLRRIFPPAKDRYIFGPMAIIGWGTPTLVEARVGILLELPDPVRLVLLGEVSACLPDKEKAIVELHISVLGILDFGKKTLSIDASLHDSRILAFTLFGDMALRLSWGEPPNFAFSLGGLNPHFQPPPSFPNLRRLTLALCTGDNPRLSLQAYLALTSNTVQFGARAELYVNVGVLDLNIYGFVGFDVLINFSPFSFIADLAAMIAVRMGNTVLFGLYLEATLSGPSPWHVKGKAVFTFIVPIPVEFDETFGPTQKPQPLPPSDPWSKLQEAVSDRHNWSASSTLSGTTVVSLSVPKDETASVLIDPMGQVTFRQKVLPFNRKITCFGHTRPSGASRYDLSAVLVGQKPSGQWSTLQDYFAPAQFEALSDAQKLSRPSFEKMDAGVTVGSRVVDPGVHVSRDIVYETIIMDAPWITRKPGLYQLKRDHQAAMTGLGAASRSQLKTTGNQRYMPAAASAPAAAMDDEQYIIVSTADFSRLKSNQPSSKGAAFQTLDDLIAADPAERDRWQVVPVFEAEAIL